MDRSDEDTDEEERVARSLVGRTITRVRLFNANSYAWAHHETFWLWLDDGRVVEFSSYGHDEDGATLKEITPSEVGLSVMDTAED